MVGGGRAILPPDGGQVVAAPAGLGAEPAAILPALLSWGWDAMAEEEASTDLVRQAGGRAGALLLGHCALSPRQEC